MRRASVLSQPRRLVQRLIVALALAGTVGAAAALAAPGQPSQQQPGNLQLPPGFRVNVFAEGLGYVRMMAFSPQGDLVATSSSPTNTEGQCGGGGCGQDIGRVLALPDRDGDGVADRTITLADGLDRPHGIAYHDGALYVAEHGRVIRLPNRETPLGPADVEVVVPDLPINPHNGHWTRTLVIAPDGTMYVSAGSSCNVCEEDEPRRAAVLRYNRDGSGEQILAHGLRNAVGIAVDPARGALWATVNQRDLLGDDFPPDYVSVVQQGDHFGWPFCNNGVRDPDFGHLGDCSQTRAPSVLLGSHSAPLGLAFYTGQQFPAEYHGDLFVALHGSWNRSEPQGYKVVRIPMAGGAPGAVQDFITGFLPAEPGCDNRPADASRGTAICRANAWARPVGIAVGPDGAMYVSDDRGGTILRITYAP
jgi:glucose/arabinose dehydrogenase